MSKITSIRLDDELTSQLDILGDAMDRPQSWLIKQAARSYIHEQSW